MIIVNKERARVLDTPHGSEIRPLMDRTTSDTERCSLAEESLPPGRAVGLHYHVETEELYYILEGAGEMTVDDETCAVAAGDCVFIPRGAVHSLRNTGGEIMRLLLVCGPAYTPSDHHQATSRGRT